MRHTSVKVTVLSTALIMLVLTWLPRGAQCTLNSWSGIVNSTKSFLFLSSISMFYQLPYSLSHWSFEVKWGSSLCDSTCKNCFLSYAQDILVWRIHITGRWLNSIDWYAMCGVLHVCWLLSEPTPISHKYRSYAWYVFVSIYFQWIRLKRSGGHNTNFHITF